MSAIRQATMKRATVFALLLGALGSAASRDAHADGMFPEKGVYMPIGVNLGYGINPRPLANGFLFGGEASVVYFDRFRWVGATRT